MYFAVPTSSGFGTNDKVREFASVDKLNTFLLNLSPSDKFMIIEGNKVNWKKDTSINFMPSK